VDFAPNVIAALEPNLSKSAAKLLWGIPLLDPIRERRRKKREAIKTFVQGARTGDFQLFCAGLELVDHYRVWEAAIRAVAKCSAAIVAAQGRTALLSNQFTEILARGLRAHQSHQSRGIGWLDLFTWETWNEFLEALTSATHETRKS
jgi:hypothetical protein